MWLGDGRAVGQAEGSLGDFSGRAHTRHLLLRKPRLGVRALVKQAA